MVADRGRSCGKAGGRVGVKEWVGTAVAVVFMLFPEGSCLYSGEALQGRANISDSVVRDNKSSHSDRDVQIALDGDLHF